MNCRQVEEKLADWSADNLPEHSCNELKEHLHQCPPCARHWNEFEQTITTVSTSSQPVLPPEKSQEMWRCCERYLAEKAERERNAQRNEQRDVQSARSKTVAPASSWWNINPRWGWASLAGALVVLAAAGLVPQNAQRPVVETSSSAPTNTSNTAPREEWIRFTLPPAQASPFINHHASMAFDPFADHVATTLISDAATSTQAVPVTVSDSSFVDSSR